jgi:hypothetical protein
MISKTYILKNLKAINSKYIASKTAMDGLFFSKLSVLELCGWIESSIDDMISRSIRCNITDPDYQKIGIDGLKQIYGFQFERNFRKVIISSVGVIGLYKIESKIDEVEKDSLKRLLNKLTIDRNSLAHTYIKGVTHQIDAPSITISHFHEIYKCLKTYDDQFRKQFPGRIRL